MSGYLRSVRFAFDDLITGEHREAVWNSDSMLTAEQVAHEVFDSLGRAESTETVAGEGAVAAS